MRKRAVLAGIAVVALSFGGGATTAAGWWDKPQAARSPAPSYRRCPPASPTR